MTIKNALPGTKAYRDVKALYHSAFPQDERLPFTRLAVLNLVRSSVDLLAHYDGNVFCGLSFTVCTDRYLYINYFAVNPERRDKGYGTRMVSELRKRSLLPAVCDAKVPVEGSPEESQDVKRIKFWERNGFDFFHNEYTITNPYGVKYYICSTQTPFDRQAYRDIFDHLSFGPKAQLRIWKRKLKK